MRPSQAAKTIGLSISQMRQAIRKGLIPSKKKPNPLTPGAHIYELKEADVLWYKEHRPRPGPKKKEPANDHKRTGDVV